MNKILITGASGSLGHEVAKQLLQIPQHPPVVVMARNLAKVDDLRQLGAELRLGDYEDRASLDQAFQGIDQLYFVSGNEIPKRAAQHRHVIAAAQAAGVKHVVYTSFQRVNDTASSPIAAVADVHWLTEQLLRDSGLSHSILRHGLYMDMLPMFLGPNPIAQGRVVLPAGQGKGAFVARQDLALAGARLLASRPQQTATLNFYPQEAWSMGEIAALLAKVGGKPVAYLSPDPAEFKAQLEAIQLPPMVIDMTLGFAEAIRQGEFAATSTQLTQFMGRQPLGMQEFLQKTYAPQA